MAETPGAPESGTSATAGAPGEPGQGFDYESAYANLRPEYTRTTQRLSEYEQLFSDLHNPDPEIRAEAAQLLGLEFAEETGAPATPAPGTTDNEFVDPLEEEVKTLREQVAELRQRSELEASRVEEQRTLDLRDEYIAGTIDFITESTGQKFSEAEEEVLGNLAIAMADDDDVPDVQGAYQRLYGEQGVIESRLQQRIESKTGAALPPLGTSIPADKKPKTAEDRINYMDERWRQLSDQQ